MKELENKQKDEEEEKKWKELVEKVKLRRAGGPNLEQGVSMRNGAVPNPNGTRGGQGARHPFIKPTSRSCQDGGQQAEQVEQGVSINKIAMPNHPESAGKRKRTFWIDNVPEEVVASPLKRRRGHDNIQQSDGPDIRKVVKRNGIFPQSEKEGQEGEAGEGGTKLKQ
jgi:hypothetical protein